VKALAASALLIAALAGPAGMAAPARPPASLCRSDERPLFTCRAKRSLISLCAGRASVHYRYGLPGSPAIDLANLPDWSNVHIGGVVGQGDGHQDHVRMSAGQIHYMIYSGFNGRLSDDPGKTYAGVNVSQGKTGETQIVAITCTAPASVASGWTEAVRATAPKRLREGLDEVSGGPFDGWF
jgi:hypothetical protein